MQLFAVFLDIWLPYFLLGHIFGMFFVSFLRAGYSGKSRFYSLLDSPGFAHYLAARANAGERPANAPKVIFPESGDDKLDLAAGAAVNGHQPPQNGATGNTKNTHRITDI
jgi:hypothetical protein